MEEWRKNYNFWIKKSPKKISEQLKSYSLLEKQNNFEYKNINFGTSGIREKIGYGSNLINEFNINAFILAFGKTLKKNFSKKELKKRSVIIFHDNRKNGDFFSKEASRVLSKLKINVLLSKDSIPQPSPFLSYLIKEKKCLAGINITASHNPKEYSGVKFYDENGIMINDDLISEILKFKLKIKNIFKIKKNNLKINYLENEEEENKYLEKICSNIIYDKKYNFNNLNLTFSSNHGASYNISNKILKKLELKFNFVEEQINYDQDFTNSIYPNPQDIKGYEFAKEYAKKIDSDIIFASDPDGDRYGIMVKHKDEWVFLNGNETPIIQIYYKILYYKKNNLLKPNKQFVTKSYVTSNLGINIIKKYNLNFFETFTGFKSILNLSHKKILNGMEHFFSWEESNGSLIDFDISRDKDSFQNLVNIIEIASNLKRKNETLVDFLEKIYSKFGFFIMQSKNFKLKNEEDLKLILIKINSFKINDLFGGNKILKIKKIDNNKTVFLYFENNSFICFRPSGTEPIFKVYFDLNFLEKEKTKQEFENIKKEVKIIFKK